MTPKENRITAYLKSEEGQANAKRFILALKERRVICSVKHVSNSGMSRVISVNEVKKLKGQNIHVLYHFNWFFKQMGYTYVDSYSAIRVNGCGMDMIFNLLDCVCADLKYYGGFKLPENYTALCSDYMCV